MESNQLPSLDDEALWFPSAEILRLIKNVTANRRKAERLLDKQVAAGAWQARAKASVSGLDFGPISETIPTKPSYRYSKIDLADENGFIFIGQAFWTMTRSSLYGDRVWNWKRGIFAFVDRPSAMMKQFDESDKWYVPVHKRIVIYGVEFLKSDVLELVSKLEAKLNRPRKRGRSGPRRKKWIYAPVMARLESDVEDGTIERFGMPDGYGVQADIENFISSEMSQDGGGGPPVSSVRLRARQIMDLWRGKIALGG